MLDNHPIVLYTEFSSFFPVRPIGRCNMLRGLLSIALLLGFIQAPQPLITTTVDPNTEYKLYLPLSINTSPSVEIITLGHTWRGRMIVTSCVYGYTSALTSSAVYSVTLATDIILPPNTYAYTDYISPALVASLPNQKNPFSHCVSSLVTTGYYHGGVKLVSGNLNSPNGRLTYPLTVTSWKRKTSESGVYIFGTVRNDSGHRLVDIRAVGILSAGILYSLCPSSAYEAVLETTTLDPGEKADFKIMECTEDVSEISAQGVAEP
jgi:hypothetical protein